MGQTLASDSPTIYLPVLFFQRGAFPHHEENLKIFVPVSPEGKKWVKLNRDFNFQTSVGIGLLTSLGGMLAREVPLQSFWEGFRPSAPPFAEVTRPIRPVRVFIHYAPPQRNLYQQSKRVGCVLGKSDRGGNAPSAFPERFA